MYKQEENKDSNTEAKAMLNGIEQSCSLTGFGDTSCITGYGVQVKDIHTGLVGLFYIDSDTHRWSGGEYTIDLELNFKNIMNEVEAGQDEQTESKSTENTSSSSAENNSKAEKALSFCKSKLGTPYQWGGTGPRYDCSGLMLKAYESVGIKLPRTSKQQSTYGKSVSKSSLQIGDLVFFGSPVHHVGMYCGNNQYIHSPKTGDVVKISSLSSRKDYTCARRVV